MTDATQPGATTQAETGGPAPRTGARPAGYAPAPSGWTGWVVFGGVMLIVLGFFQVIEGLVALFHDGFYLVRPNGLVVNVNYNAWGWTHLIIGIVAALIGLGLLVGNTFARVAGVIVAVLSALANMAFVAAYPVWSLTVIALDIVVLYAIIVHGGELKSSS